MKNSLIFLFLIVMYSCNPSKPSASSAPKVDTVTIVKDSVIYITTVDHSPKDSMIKEMNLLKDSLFLERYKIERVHYYLKICQRKPSQTKFLVSWINRAIK